MIRRVTHTASRLITNGSKGLHPLVSRSIFIFFPRHVAAVFATSTGIRHQIIEEKISQNPMSTQSRLHQQYPINLPCCQQLRRVGILGSMSKPITPHFEQVIGRFIAGGRFNNKSEVIRAGLRLLEEHETKASASLSREDLTRIIRTALDDTRPLIPAAKLLCRRSRR